ncbi:MAG TPA: helix-turn-helix transcriptional regulator [Hyphomicrobium sp.]|uniref:helix-turn-helix domain-containing protein n=1 Tax=Hyphomicrobium sp. TaxID=82 RepID=UPI002B6F18BF|nr:helix-turn-helix transcriptional regulator [Hyphomicrobium sp.]HRN88217.1 helix-turn-helix transcriptional regulator [Hyphomicrobium sp.]
MTEEKSPSDIFKVRLRAARELRELNQTELALKAKLPPSSIAHFESGSRKPSFDNLKRLAGALDVSSDYLLGRSDDPAVAQSADTLYRDVSRLSDEDRKMAEKFIRMLQSGRKESEDQ